MTEIPRRIDICRNTLAELAIRAAVQAVEEAGCDPYLTDAIVLMSAAKDKVSDFVDGIQRIAVATDQDLAKILCPGCADGLLKEGSGHWWIDGKRVEPCLATAERVEKLKDWARAFVSGDKPRHAVGVSVLITRERDGMTEVLLGRRKNNSAAGLLSTPGGRLEKFETIVKCAMREVYEETGASIFFEQLEIIGWREHFRYGDHYIMFYVHARSYIGADSKPNGSFENRIPDKSEDWKFYALDTIKLEETTEPCDILDQLRPKTLMDPTGTIHVQVHGTVTPEAIRQHFQGLKEGK